MRAAVLWEAGAPLSVEDVELEPPRAGEVQVRIAAAGVCRSDLHVMEGTWTPELPLVLGHEGAGVVEAVGPGVISPRVGDAVGHTQRLCCKEARAGPFRSRQGLELCRQAFSGGLVSDV